MDFLSCISIRKEGEEGFLCREADLEFDKLKINAKDINGTGHVGERVGDCDGTACSACGQIVICFSFLNILIYYLTILYMYVLYLIIGTL